MLVLGTAAARRAEWLPQLLSETALQMPSALAHLHSVIFPLRFLKDELQVNTEPSLQISYVMLNKISARS